MRQNQAVGGAIRTLLIEDDQDCSAMFRSRLLHDKTFRFDVSCAATLKEGLDVLGRHKIDVVLLDLNLPDSHGLETFNQIHANHQSVAVVVLTGIDDKDLPMDLVRRGAEDYLVKGDIDGKMLAHILKYAIERNKHKRMLSSLTEQLKIANRRLEELTLLDPLTDILNRRGLQQVLSREVAWARRQGDDLLAILIDLDDFKRINDRLGHATGDIVLKEIAAKLKRCLRATDYVSRVGGDEMIVLLPRTRPAEGMLVAEKIRLSISGLKVLASAGKQVTVTASLGMIKVFPDTTPSIDELLTQAHSALRKSKETGKNKISFDREKTEERRAVPHALAGVLDRFHRGEGLYAVKMPIMDLIYGHEVGFEFLSRMSVKGFENPDDFFRICMEHDLLTVVDHHCFKICSAASRSLADTLKSHINVFPSTLLAIPVQHLLEDLPPDRQKGLYCIEISEQQIIGDPSYLSHPVRELKQAGVSVSIDDVGFGHSCLESLILLEPETVKIDKSWIIGISKAPARQRSLARLIKMADGLGSEVIAEGIETQEDLDFLKSLGVKYGQGFFWGKPK